MPKINVSLSSPSNTLGITTENKKTVLLDQKGLP